MAGKGCFVCGVPQGTESEEEKLLKEFEKLSARLLAIGISREQLHSRIEKGGNDHA